MAYKTTEKHVNFGFVKLSGGWSGAVSLADSWGKRIDLIDWRKCLEDVDRILKSSEKDIKVDSETSVSIVRLTFGGRERKVVIKCHKISRGVVGLLRQLFRNKSLRNYKTAVRLHNQNIPVVFPYAALKKKAGLFTEQCVFITEYVEGSCDLHGFVVEKISLEGKGSPEQKSLKNVMGSQAAQIFAGMHECGLWHRDAKAGNFLVCPGQEEGGHQLKLVDMDGIKRSLPGLRRRGELSLAKLASTLMFHGGIFETDYLRSFVIYSNLLRLNKRRARKLFKNLARRAVGLRVMTLVKSAVEYGRN